MEIQAIDILKILPHRYPFLLVDRILELTPGERAVGLKNITLNEHFFMGHFPGRPIMPGVLIIEMMAQVGGVCLLTKEGNQGKLAYLAGIDKSRFRKPVVPGDQLITEVNLLWIRGSVGRMKTEARLDNKVICDGELTFALMSPDEVEQQAKGDEQGESS